MCGCGSKAFGVSNCVCRSLNKRGASLSESGTLGSDRLAIGKVAALHMYEVCRKSPADWVRAAAESITEPDDHAPSCGAAH